MRLIDADALINRMYHDAFETDTDMQKWDSGCWIRYKMFENAIDEAPRYETKQIKYFDEEERVWKIGDVIVEHTERIQEEIPEYEPWRDAFDGMDCCSMEVQDDNGDDID